MKNVTLIVMLGSGILALATARTNGQDAEQRWLAKEISNAQVVQKETEDYLEQRLPPFPQVKTAEEWQTIADTMRRDTLARVIYRGEAARWRDTPSNIEWLETIPGGSIPGGPEYSIRKLRFEAIPGMWLPGLLYLPKTTDGKALDGKMPVALNVNGHDPDGKAAIYKQIRCINQVKRGMIVFNPEWFNMGELRGDGYAHSRLNQLDLCGTSGMAPFYLSMKRSLDLLLSHPNADPSRVVVSGLSGGGWQTILISSLDTRVTLANPVAGYSSFRTRIRNHSDLGDSEQTPVDLGASADYAQLTAMLAPRAALLTYNAKDNCCFASAHALPPLLATASPIYQLFGKSERLRSHVNEDPGNHNFEKDNRQALYRMMKDHFFPNDASITGEEIECQGEVKPADALRIGLPAGNRTLHSVALDLAQSLPKDAELPKTADQAAAWAGRRREELKQLVAAKPYAVAAQMVDQANESETAVIYWRLRVGDTWTVPAVELSRGEPKSVAVVLHDGGRKASAGVVNELLAMGHRVIAIDPFHFGENQFAQRAYLWGLLVSTVGDRPLGLQASQVAAVCRWLKNDRQLPAAQIVAAGSRSSLIGLVAAATEPDAVQGVRCGEGLGSLKEILERNYTADQFPELFCFGLLERFDIRQLAALVAPRPVTYVQPSERARGELAPLREYYQMLGSSHSVIP